MAGASHLKLRFTCKSLQTTSGGTRIRTGDTMIFSHVLYQLSYPARETWEDSPPVILRHAEMAIKRSGSL